MCVCYIALAIFLSCLYFLKGNIHLFCLVYTKTYRTILILALIKHLKVTKKLFTCNSKSGILSFKTLKKLSFFMYLVSTTSK